VTLTEHFTDLGSWADSCRHQVDQSTAGQVEQLVITGEPSHNTVAQCMRCGEWVSLANRQETLI
jgi:hypothetical protein